MSIKERLEHDMKQAMRDRDAGRLACIRMLRAKLLEREVALRPKLGREHALDDDEALSVIAAYAKQRRESIESFRAGGRDDLARAEQAELEIIAGYLPAPLGEDELRRIVERAIAETGASSPREMGRVMNALMAQLRGRAEGSAVSRLVKELLGG
jgi:uncharacterized protein YqeY